eukprot:gene13053-3829_t
MSLKSEEKMAGGDSTLVEKLMSELETSKKEASKLKELNGVLVKKSKDREMALKMEKNQCQVEINDLKIQMEGLTEVLNYQQDMADELVQREPEKVKKLKRQKKELTDKCQEKEKQLEKMKKSLQEIKFAFESKETENKEIKEAILELKGENIKLLSENSLLEGRFEEKENNLFKKEEKIADLELEIVELKNKMQKDQTCIARQASIISNLEATIEQKEIDAVKKDLRIWELKQEMKEANTKVIKEVAEITVKNVIREAGDKAQILNLENKNISLRSEIESLMQKTERLEKLVAGQCTKHGSHS